MAKQKMLEVQCAFPAGLGVALWSVISVCIA